MKSLQKLDYYSEQCQQPFSWFLGKVCPLYLLSFAALLFSLDWISSKNTSLTLAMLSSSVKIKMVGGFGLRKLTLCIQGKCELLWLFHNWPWGVVKNIGRLQFQSQDFWHVSLFRFWAALGSENNFLTLVGWKLSPHISGAAVPLKIALMGISSSWWHFCGCHTRGKGLWRSPASVEHTQHVLTLQHWGSCQK